MMEMNPKIVPVTGLGEAAAQAQSLAIQQSSLGTIFDPGTTTAGMFPTEPTVGSW